MDKEKQSKLLEILDEASGETAPGYSGTYWEAFLPRIEEIFRRQEFPYEDFESALTAGIDLPPGGTLHVGLLLEEFRRLWDA